ncbi:hypothetical protein [Saccharomonospora iraqiensis]|nr:hypothetical protein [Saccharomonospora iraqiensis]
MARPDRRRDTVDGRYCPGCVDDCLADRHPGHWCPIDELGSTE